jgi:hypothetical protein
MTMAKWALALVLLLTVQACGGGSATAPSPPPAPPTFSLSGQVADIRTSAVISGAVVSIVDSANAGKSTTTDSAGNYSFTGLQQAGFTVGVSANGYVSTPEFLGWTSANLPSGSTQLLWRAKNEPVMSYTIEVGTTVGGTDVAIIDTGTAVTSYTLTGLRTSMNVYHVRVRARNACGVSPPSNEASPRVA